METVEFLKYLELVEYINVLNNEYYNKNNSLVSDYTYDKLYRDLQKIEEEHPEWIRNDSPTKKVGSSLNKNNKFEKIKHEIPMQSLSNSYDIEDVRRFIERIAEAGSNKIIIEPKYDGLSLSLEYNNHHLIRALTRGDGEIGEDVTENIRGLDTIPENISIGDHVFIRGEIVISFDKFEEINKQREELKLPLFANPRNLASGSLRQLDSNICRERGLDFVAYFVYFIDEESDDNYSQQNIMKLLDDLGFNQKLSNQKHQYFTIDLYNNKNRLQIKEIHDFIKAWEKSVDISTDLYPTDGLVVKVNERYLWDKIGTNAKAPKWAIAYKFNPDIKETKLLDVKFQVGRTGKVTPVAEFEPIRIKGTVVSRATLHNFDEIDRLDIRIGDIIRVYKAAEIIPKVDGVNVSLRSENGKIIQVPKTCPICGSELVKPDGNVDVYCMNSNCGAKVYANLLHFASRNCMNIIGLGEAVLSDLMKNKLVSNIPDIYRLKNHRKELENLETLGVKSTDNLLKAIEDSKKTEFYKKIFALGIPDIGYVMSKKISKCISDFYSDHEIGRCFNSINNISARKSLEDWASNKKNINMILELRDLGVLYERGKPASFMNDNPLKGKRIAITGGFERYNRRYLEDLLIDKLGATINSSVTNNTDYLLVQDKSELGNGSKVRDAKKYCTKIIDISELEDIILKMKL